MKAAIPRMPAPEKVAFTVLPAPGAAEEAAALAPEATLEAVFSASSVAPV